LKWDRVNTMRLRIAALLLAFKQGGLASRVFAFQQGAIFLLTEQKREERQEKMEREDREKEEASPVEDAPKKALHQTGAWICCCSVGGVALGVQTGEEDAGGPSGWRFHRAKLTLQPPLSIGV
jgi:hypothetical protein